MVGHTTRKRKIKGSIPSTGIRREKMAIKEEIYVRKVVPIDISASGEASVKLTSLHLFSPANLQYYFLNSKGAESTRPTK